MDRKRIVIAVAAVAALSACSSAKTAYGGIMAIDTTKHTVKLYSNDTYTFAADTDLSKLTVGEAVSVSYSTDPTGKVNNATSISPL